MKNPMIFLLFATFMVLQAMTTLSAEQEMLVMAGSNTSSSLGGNNGVFLGSSWRPWRPMTCDRHPKVCRKPGSPGRDCCRKRCVNLRRDRANCGRCGHKCRYSEICCKGRCVRPSSDPRNCGRCGNKCKRGIACVHGFCCYA